MVRVRLVLPACLSALCGQASAFTAIPGHGTHVHPRTRGPMMTQSAPNDNGLGDCRATWGNASPVSRREFTTLAVSGALGLGLAAGFGGARRAEAAGGSLEDLIADIMVAKAVFKPAIKYFEAQQYDAARTNCAYVTRQIKLKKVIDDAIVAAYDVVDDPDKIEKAIDLATEVEATVTNFDSSVYTIIFIPPDENGVYPPGAEKYSKQAFTYYDQVISIMDYMLALAPEDVLEKAKGIAATKEKALPGFLFKDKYLK